MGSLRRLAFWIEGIPTLTTAGESFFAGPLERVARAADGTWTPVALEFAKRHNLTPDQLKVRGRGAARRLGVTRRREAALAATVLPRALPELLDMLDSKDRADSRRTMPFRQALAWLVVLLGDTRIRFKWHEVQADRYTYAGNQVSPQCRIAVPHFYEYHATLAQAGIRVDEATRREHLLLQLNAAASDLGGRSVASERQLTELSFCLDRPKAHIHRGMPAGLNAAFVEAAAERSTYCVAVRRDGGGLAQGWVVVAEEDEELLGQVERVPSEAEAAHRVFGRVLEDAALWLGTRVQAVEKRVSKQRIEAFLVALARQIELSKSELANVVAAGWLCESAMSTLAFREYPGAHLLLALQRASSASRTGKAVRQLVDEVLQVSEAIGSFTAPLVGEKAQMRATPGSFSNAAAALFLVLAFQHLVAGFGARRVPLIEHDPLALRPLAERLFSLLILKRWPVPIVGVCETAARLWGASDNEALSVRRPAVERVDPAFDGAALEHSLAAFLRHRMRRYAEKSGGTGSEQVPETGEWSPATLPSVCPQA